MRGFAFSLVALVSVGACTKPRPAVAPKSVAVAPSVALGECAERATDGVTRRQRDPNAKVVSENADRDLNADGQLEVVTVDRAMCEGENCHWNIFSNPGSGGDCTRFWGTISGAYLQVANDELPGDQGFLPLRSFWRLGEQRLLVQSYRFSAGGYRLVDALICRASDDQKLLCAEK